MTYETTDIRNVALVGHAGCGKTSLCEAILFCAKAVDRLGRVDAGTTAMDFDPDEVKRNISISSSFFDFEWKKKKKINLIDTPGDADFNNDAQISLSVADNAVIVVDAVGGVEIQTERMWKKADEMGIPKVIFISKLDRERSDFDRVLASIKTAFKCKVAVMTYPIGKEASLSGVVDLFSGKALAYAGDASGKYDETDAPSDLSSTIDTLRGEMIENIAESNDALLEKYLEGGEISPEELSQGLKEGFVNGTFVPVFAGSGIKNIGAQPFIEFITKSGASPADRQPVKAAGKGGAETIVKADPNGPLTALVFKTIADPYAGKLSIFRVFSGTMKADSTVANTTKGTKERVGQIMYIRGKGQKPTSAVPAGDIAAVAKLKDTATGDTLSDESGQAVFPGFEIPPQIMFFAIKPKSKGDEDKVMSSIHRLMEEDMTLKIHRDELTKELVLSGMGQVHLEVMMGKLKSKFGVEVELSTPKVPYLETVRKKAHGQGRYKKQTGGRGQFGDTWLDIEPMPRGGGFEFVDKIVGGAVPRQYIPACQKGIEEAMLGGVLAGYPVTDIRISLTDGSYHSVDSSEMAFKIAASMGFKKIFMEASPVLLEPIMRMEVVVPEDYVGDVMGDLNSRRGRVAGVDVKDGIQIIKALVPMAEVLTYAPDLRSITSGRGTFTMEIDHYEEVPALFAEKIVQAAQKEKEES